MNDDRLLRDLAQAAREEHEHEMERWDERWDRLAAGTLSAAEEAELRALAATSEEARLAYEAFRPLGPELQARVAAAIRAQTETGVPREAPQPARVLPFRRWSGWLGGSLAAVAAAACLVLLLSTPAGLPPYTLDVFGGDQTQRGVPAGPGTARVLHPGSTIEVTVRPETGVSGPVAAHWYVTRGGEVRKLSGRTEISQEGAVRLSGTLGKDLAIAPGDWALWVVVGRPGKLPDPMVLAAHPGARSLRKKGWIARGDEVTLRVEAER